MNATIRWRKNDPADEAAMRWTKAHRLNHHDDNWTACGQRVPVDVYMVDYDNDIPTGAPVCKRCERAK
jgi:hypothetical protein